MVNQFSEYFSNILNTYLTAFRKGFGCLLRLLGDWKRELDNHRYVGAILMDLSEAFDCLPHGQLLYIYIYEGRSICNENSPVYPKVLYLHTS